MTVFTDGPRTAEFLISEANGHLSRKAGNVDATGGALEPGTVMGRKNLGAASAEAQAGNTGNATIGTITRGPNCKVGVYKVEFTAATKFDVIDPNGVQLAEGTTGVAYATELGFTITAGGTPMVAGDGFDITVAEGNGDWVALVEDGTDGSQVAQAILFEGIGAVEASRTLITRHAEIKADKLTWFDEADSDQIAAGLAQLEALGIVAR